MLLLCSERGSSDGTGFWLRNEVPEFLGGLDVRPDGDPDLSKGFLVGLASRRAVGDVGDDGDVCVVFFVRPEDVYLEAVFYRGFKSGRVLPGPGRTLTAAPVAGAFGTVFAFASLVGCTSGRSGISSLAKTR